MTSCFLCFYEAGIQDIYLFYSRKCDVDSCLFSDTGRDNHEFKKCHPAVISSVFPKNENQIRVLTNRSYLLATYNLITCFIGVTSINMTSETELMRIS